MRKQVPAPSLRNDIIFACRKKCPACGQGDALENITQVVKKCSECNAPLGENDIGDGAIVFLQFILCIAFIPILFAVEIWLKPPVWVHVILVLTLSAVVMLVLLPVIKVYILLLEHRHRTVKK